MTEKRRIKVVADGPSIYNVKVIDLASGELIPNVLDVEFKLSRNVDYAHAVKLTLYDVLIEVSGDADVERETLIYRLPKPNGETEEIRVRKVFGDEGMVR